MRQGRLLPPLGKVELSTLEATGRRNAQCHCPRTAGGDRIPACRSTAEACHQKCQVGRGQPSEGQHPLPTPYTCGSTGRPWPLPAVVPPPRPAPRVPQPGSLQGCQEVHISPISRGPITQANIFRSRVCEISHSSSFVTDIQCLHRSTPKKNEHVFIFRKFLHLGMFTPKSLRVAF